MSVLLNPTGFIVDDSVEPFIHDRRIDLLSGADPPFFPATPEFKIFEYLVEKDTVLLVKAIVPYAQVRINPGLVTERLQFVPSSVGNTSFVFTPYVNQGAIGLFDWQYNPANTAATATNAPTVGGKGFTTISQEPKQDAERAWLNPMLTYCKVDPSQTFRVTFKLLPSALAGPNPPVVQGTPMPGNFAIGAVAPETAQRVDMAGCVVVGMQMSKQAYNQMIGEMRERKLRKAESHKIVVDAWAWAKKKWGT